ncbi:MAG: hypothetical protein GEU75_12595 [Dehalococcoidia bacterium]|nr:hypothetical protein [Dehalococcoidia bacterium]
MAIGPVELLVVRFPGNQFTGEIVPALTDLVKSDTIRVLDILFIRKDASRQTEMVEIKDLVTGDPNFEPVIAGLTDLLTEADVEEFGSMLEPDSSAAMMLFENSWATHFASTLRKARGEVVLNARIPRAVIDELMETSTA